MSLARTTSSDHLRSLEAAGIVTDEIERPGVSHSCASSALASLRRFPDEALDASSITDI